MSVEQIVVAPQVSLQIQIQEVAGNSLRHDDRRVLLALPAHTPALRPLSSEWTRVEQADPHPQGL